MSEYYVDSSAVYDFKAQKDQLFKFFAESESEKAVAKGKTLAKPRL